MKAVFYIVILIGVGYGAYSLISSGDDEAAEAGDPQVEPAGETSEEQPATADVAELSGRADDLIGKADAAETRALGHAYRDQARRLLGRALLTARDSKEIARLKARIGILNDQVLFSDEAIEGKSFLYTFGATDRLWNLCRGGFPGGVKPRVAPGFLLWMNGISSARSIREGQILKITMEDLSLRVVKSRFELWVLLGGVFLKEFPVGLGVQDKTPEGSFIIGDRLKDPDWYRNGRKIPFGHPDNRLGTRWLGFKRTARATGYGIHGTDEPGSIGKEVSEGCVRLRNEDVEALFEWVQVGTEVEIVR